MDRFDDGPIQTPDHPRMQENCMMAALVGAAVVFVYMTLTRPTSPVYYPAAHQVGARATAYLATAGQMLSARIGEAADHVVAVETSGGLLDAHDVYDKVPKGAVALVDCTKRTQDGWKQMSDAEKQTCHATAKGLVHKKDQVAFMLFAPWCPHCHDAMVGFAEMSAKHPNVPSMINAEALPRAAFTGDKPFYPSEYFPTFAVKTGTGGASEGVDRSPASPTSLRPPPPSGPRRPPRGRCRRRCHGRAAGPLCRAVLSCSPWVRIRVHE